MIGINQYKHWQSLRRARLDAEKVAAVLGGTYGFTDLRTLYDSEATRENILRVLRKLTKELTAADALLVYFAGHGYNDKLLQKGYWVPSEAREEVEREPAVGEWLPNTELHEHVRAMQARHVLVVSDSCFSGTLLRGGKADLSGRDNTIYRKIIAQPSRWCLTSGDLESVPDESVFARKFLNLLEYPQQPVFSVQDIGVWIRKEVAADGGTEPRCKQIQDPSGSSNGEFVFLAMGGLTAGARLRPRRLPWRRCRRAGRW